MSLSRRQQWLLAGIDDAISRPDPGTAPMLAAFDRITAGQPMPRREELCGPASRIRAALLLAAASTVRNALHLAGAACAVPGPIPGGDMRHHSQRRPRAPAPARRWLAGPVPAVNDLKEDIMRTRHDGAWQAPALEGART